jgi:hypothetical protein
MRGRCRNPNHSSYGNYGARGISVCAEWNDFPTFRAWAEMSGYRDDLTIERINNDGGYEPGNCRWASKAEQVRNNRRNHSITAFGETKLLTDWFNDPRCAVSCPTLFRRISKGMDPEDALMRCPYQRSAH